MPSSHSPLTVNPPKDIKRVLVFDSGVGGLSVCREIIALSPTLEVHYLSDNAAFPYGKKPADELIARVSQVLKQADRQIKPDIVVIACNTASTVVLPSLRNTLTLPIVGVVPAIKTAAAISRTKTFGLLATPGTVKRAYTQQLITQYAASNHVIRVGSSELVRRIESHIHGDAIDTDYIEQIVERLSKQTGGEHIDTVVLGCTHFPLISDHFKKIKPHWKWIDSGAAIAARVNALLTEPYTTHEIHTNHIARTPQHSAWLTQSSNRQSTLDQYLNQHAFSASNIFVVD